MSLISDFVALLQIVLCGWEIFGSDRSPRRGNLVCACVRYFSQLRFKDSKSIFEGVLQRRAERKQELSQKVKRESSEELRRELRRAQKRAQKRVQKRANTNSVILSHTR